jgi:hypothetical protein
LTFSAPKSVSVLFALSDAEARTAVRAAHDLAVREALGHVERTAAAVRRGHGGARRAGRRAGGSGVPAPHVTRW